MIDWKYEYEAEHEKRLVDKARIRELEAALQGIAKLGSLTLLGGRGMESERAYEAGANAAFGQAADIARDALEDHPDEQEPAP